ncbi:hypothetical protein BDU57DRAFT_558329 [Ampelomyces quisqualis]|uniref:DUF4484 domain-containing protein n=1 Tax=Ampelomyces quisqualis TaxID=50730 RepID=A0A6A5QHC0_AMPQU|nr:hypothetical protein BDU57DRAFT_558329 [Ampelomyces quisqualis]
MSASIHSSANDVDAGDAASPHVEALFLIRFDKRVGYTVAWKRTTSGVSLENAVEYKSLPSGLHALDSDLVYFTHEGRAGLSAFARGTASAEERNASFVAVGVLARRDGEYGRLGRAWLLAGRLAKLAVTLAEDAQAVAPLEAFWAEQTAASAPTTDADEQLPAYHPARSMVPYLDVFGPLVFRLQQVALLRKRILFVGRAPVRAMCEFVYMLSMLSTISARDAALLVPGTDALLRLPTLFCVGVHDVPALEALRDQGWAACTTDAILATKTALYDIIVEMPSHSCDRQRRTWPQMRTSAGTHIRASQRDVARFKFMRKELFQHRNQATDDDDDDAATDDNDTAPLISRPSVDAQRAEQDYISALDDHTLVEPLSWSRLAHRGFMWWASAGEADAYLSAERDMDRDVLGHLSTYPPPVELGVIAYFHRIASTLVQGVAQVINDAEEDADSEDAEVVVLEGQHVTGLGLDGWSEADKAFVGEFGAMYFGRSVVVGRGEAACCGLMRSYTTRP